MSYKFEFPLETESLGRIFRHGTIQWDRDSEEVQIHIDADCVIPYEQFHEFRKAVNALLQKYAI